MKSPIFATRISADCTSNDKKASYIPAENNVTIQLRNIYYEDSDIRRIYDKSG